MRAGQFLTLIFLTHWYVNTPFWSVVIVESIAMDKFYKIKTKSFID